MVEPPNSLDADRKGPVSNRLMRLAADALEVPLACLWLVEGDAPTIVSDINRAADAGTEHWETMLQRFASRVAERREVVAIPDARAQGGSAPGAEAAFLGAPLVSREGRLVDCIVAMDHQGKVAEWNPAAQRTFGYSRDEAMGREMASLIIPPSLRVAHRQGLARRAIGAGGGQIP